MSKKAKFIIIFFVIMLILAITKCESKTMVGGEINFEPIKARIRHKDDHFTKERVITVYIDYFGYSKSLTEDYGIKSAKIEVVTDDLFSIKGKGEYSFSKLKEINKKTFSFKLQKTSDANRDGVIAVKLHMYKEDGEHWGTKTKELYYLTSGEDIYIGESLGDLQERFYDYLYSEGSINDEQFKNLVSEIESLDRFGYRVRNGKVQIIKNGNSIQAPYKSYNTNGRASMWLYEGDKITFKLKTKSEKGIILFQLYDYNNNEILELSKDNPSISTEIKTTGIHFLRLKLIEYYGEFDLEWEITKLQGLFL